jgi:hypothetical protein
VSGSPHSVQANYNNTDGDFTTSSGALSPGQTVNPAPVPAISTSSLPNGQFNSPYAPLTLSASGGTPPYTFSLGAGGVLPVHMTLDASGSTCGTPNTICGTPAQAGQWSVPITVTDSASSTQSVTLPLTINVASGYAGASTCSMPYPATPLYSSGVTQFGVASVALVSTISDTPSAPSSSIIASEMNVIQNNVLTGCLTGNGSGAVTSGVYTLTLSLNGGPSTLPLTLTVVGQDRQDNGTVNVNSSGIGSDVPPNKNQEGVVATGSTFTYLPASYVLDPGTSEMMFGLSGTAPQICDGPTNIFSDGPLTAPTQAGRYDVLFDGASSCPAAAFPTSPAPIVFESVDAIGTTVTYPAVGNGPTITNVVLSGSGGTSVASNVLEFESGSSATIPVTVSFNYSIVNNVCTGCVDQIAVGLNSDLGPQACPYSGIDGTGGASGSASFTINVPNSPGRYYIGFDRTEEFTCVSTWPNGVPGPSQYIGVVDVLPYVCTSNCAVGTACTSDANCASNACDGTTLTCDVSQCADNRQDGNETDIDCGGGTCGGCALTKKCLVNSDCTSNDCDAVSFTCVAHP